jgi:hypothetical protein
VAAGARDLVGTGNLKKRAYLGPTSLDNEISLIMANMAQVMMMMMMMMMMRRRRRRRMMMMTRRRRRRRRGSRGRMMMMMMMVMMTGETGGPGVRPFCGHGVEPHRVRALWCLLHGHRHRHPGAQVREG